ncbi:N-acetylmuramoyl-L-alanine amidase [Shimia abyssi]|uniref:N-acetylmuramoyl-L-alanine amidase n=1 Tax=Shimia abyssi TaxID=1662395 RepID=A0A2P8F8S6_9RHOB|nr:N-acetylmuramoyl-L-alanine amidase [Shimia abyssi]PSL18123.1 N-acetylmuramoyl-L-alanine amidase [Shimia abyssi]
MAGQLDIVDRPSPNFGPRRDELRPEYVVLHYTAMKTADAALERLCDPEFEVSAHYLITEVGQVIRLVDERFRAWHAGAGMWQGKDDLNSRSIGIELANRGNHPFSNLQMNALELLLAGILQRWELSPSCVIGHSDMAPDRKKDPGRRFDWRRLAHQRLAVWSDLGGNPLCKSLPWSESAARIGYSLDDQVAALDAFRARFRPWKTGPQDGEDAVLAESVANLIER